VLLLIDDPEIYDGACVGVQMAGRRLEEEKMLILTEYCMLGMLLVVVIRILFLNCISRLL
jgi:hypothetical protein